MNKKNVFVLAADDFNMMELKTVANAEQYNFIRIFEQDDVQKESAAQDVHQIMDKARSKIDNTGLEPHAIIAVYDFPVTLITFLLCQEYNLVSPSPLSGLKCEHKYWSRVEQQKIIPEHIPGFQAINSYDPPVFEDIRLERPFWIKPVKAFSGQLGFKIENGADYETSLQTIQNEIDKFAEPFNKLLEFIDIPEEFEKIDGRYCIAEEMISGHQCTVSGYVYDNEVVTYGVVDSVNYPNSPSFFYYMYPSKLEKSVKNRLKNISNKVIEHIGLNNSPFNIEFFYNEEAGEIKLLEINPRMSQSHSDLYAKVNGSSNHEILVNLSLGNRPHFKERAGPFAYSGKFQYRLFEDGIVSNVPDQKRIREIEELFPDTHIHLDVAEGQKLSDLEVQDSYSYCLGAFFIGGDSEQDLLRTYNQIVDELNIQID